MNSIKLRVFACIFLFLIQAQHSFAKQPKIEWGQTKDSLGLAHAKSLFSSNKLPDSETELLRQVSISIKKGVVVKKISRVSYLPTFTEANDEGTEYIYWDEATTSLTLTEASVVLPNGNLVRMNPSNIRVRDSDQYNTFTNSKEVVIPMSGVVGGSIIVLEYEKRSELSSLESLYSEVIYPIGFQRGISLFKLMLEHDKSIDIEWFNDEGGVICDYGDSQLICEGSDIEKLPYDANMSWRDEIPAIVIAQKVNWKQVVEHVKTAFNKSDYESSGVRDLALKLTSGIDSIEGKIHALHSFASRSIRYVSMSELGHRITPHTFSDVMKNLFGDCKDKSALLVGMLRVIGVDAFPVLVATERRNPAKLKVPSSTYFDHMVVCFDNNEKRFCLDPTNTSTSWHAPASWIQGRVALELKEGAKPNTIRLDDYKWVLRSKVQMDFDSSANVKEHQTRVFSGPYAGEMRAGLLNYDKKEQEEWLLKNYQDNVSTLTEPVFEIKLLDTQVSNLEIHSNADYEPYYSKEEDLYLTEYDSWIRTELTGNKITAENYGLWVDGSYVKSEVIYDFSEIWEVTRLPAKLDFSDDIATLQRSAKILDDGKLEVVTELWIKSHFIEPDEVDGYNEMIDVLISSSNIHAEGKRRAQ